MADNNEIVSFDTDELILVDKEDRAIGHLDKLSCHKGTGILHRAFSLFIFNNKGELLLQQRSDEKLLWPGYWSNSCCSHPREGEMIDDAIHRRLKQELGLEASLEFIYKFSYQASYQKIGSEHELCSVYLGQTDQAPEYNLNEIEAVRYISPQDLEIELEEKPEEFTPWFKLEWEALLLEHHDTLMQYTQTITSEGS